ncbi:MAG: efflux RND transporter permease subunit [Deltaproteobacteria bacterium]|nr:MAG: efflux RND transporter permease subunit [Deltaproteobacteria bacterium]
MSLARAIVHNRHAVGAAAIATALFGVAAYRALPMQLFPDTAPPLVTVVTAYPGAAAAEVARDLTEPIEEELSSLEGVVSVTSTSLDNLSLATVEFAYGEEVALAAVDAQNALARIRSALPGGIEEPQVLSFSTADRPVVTLGVTMADLETARRASEDHFAPSLQRVPGVAAVDVFGGHVSALIVELDPLELSARSLSSGQIVDAVRAQTMSAPAGRLRTQRTQTMLRLEADTSDAAALGAVEIPLADGGRVLLSDVARLRVGALDDDARFAIDGTPAIALQVFKTTDANTVEVVEAVRAAAAELERDFPGARFAVGEETATFTAVSIGNLLEGVLQALALASALLFLFLGRLRSAAVAIVSMPLSYGLTFALMYLAGVQFDMVTLSAVILAVGMVVDASVVVLENVARLREEEGLDPLEAAVRGADEVRTPVLAGAATTLMVLVPLMFLPGFIGKTFGPLAATLFFAFISSLAVALFLVPVLTLYTGGAGKIDRVGALLVAPFTWSMGRIRALYGGLLRLALRWRVASLLIAVASLLLAARGVLSLGMDVLPKMDSGSFFVTLETASGASLAETERVVREVEALLSAEPEVVKVQSQIGFEPGMRSGGGARGPNQAYVSVTLTDRTDRTDDIWSIERRVRAGLAGIPAVAHAVVRETGNTARPTSAAPVVLRIAGSDPLVLDRLAEEGLAILARTEAVVAPSRSWRLDQRQTRLVVDDARARAAGLSRLGVASQLMAASEGATVGQLRGRSGATLPIRVRSDRRGWADPSDLLDLPLATPRHPGGLPAREVASLETSLGQGTITREGLLYTIDLSATVEGRALSFVVADIQGALEKWTLPHRYTAALSGENDDLDDAKVHLGGALAISVLAVYLLLVAQLRSFLHPLTILVSVPLSLIGVAAALKLTGKPVSMPVMVGLILLVGIVVNNAIILIDFIRQRRDAGMPRREAVLASVQTRFRPIMMTSLSTIVGMIPLAAEWALGSERFSPLAIAVIGGMTAATFLTLVIIPVAYDLVDDAAQRLRALASAQRRRL